MPINHAFTSSKSDGADSSLVKPSDWNADHVGSEEYAEEYATKNNSIGLSAGTSIGNVSTHIYIGPSPGSGSSYRKWSLLEFALPSGITTVHRAVLLLSRSEGTNALSTASPSDNWMHIRVVRILRNWVEAEATWDVYSTGNSWTTVGAQGADTDYDSGRIAFSPVVINWPQYGSRPIEIGQIVQDAVDASDTALRLMVMLSGNSGGQNAADFYLKDDSDTLRRPTVRYWYE
jgi:hypothetical protein